MATSFNPFRADIVRIPIAEFKERFRKHRHLRLDKLVAEKEFEGDPRIEKDGDELVMTQAIWDLLVKGTESRRHRG